MIKKIAGLVVFFIVPLVLGWGAARLFQNSDILIFVGSQAHFVTFLYTIPLGYSFKVISSFRSLLGHKALDSGRNQALGVIVLRSQKAAYHLILLYVLAAVITVLWRMLSSDVTYIALSYFFGVYSITLLSISIITLWKLKCWDFEVTELLAQFTTEEKQKDEIAKQRDAQLKALELLTKDDNFTEEEKAYFLRVRSVQPVQD